jgi:glycosyltransferase involved in cell wall biosynthesis
MEPLVSILIPAYNSQEWLPSTIESALAQTWRKKEVIVVDDGSRDRTLEIAKSFGAKGVKVVEQANQGAAAARNTAFAACHGDYIQWLDADDLLEPHKIEAQVRAIDTRTTPRTLLSGAWGYFIYRTRKARFVPTPLWDDLTPVEWLLRKMGRNLHMQTDNWLVSRELTIDTGPWDVRLFRDNDGEYFSRMIIKSDGIRFVPTARSYYRQAGFTSISHIGGSSKKLESLLLSMKLHIGYIRSLEDSDRTRAACFQYIRTWQREFYPYRLDIIEELKQLTSQLGGHFEEPRLTGKYEQYDWILKLFGWSLARRVQLAGQGFRKSLNIKWDEAMFRLENRMGAAR